MMRSVHVHVHVVVDVYVGNNKHALTLWCVCVRMWSDVVVLICCCLNVHVGVDMATCDENGKWVVPPSECQGMFQICDSRTGACVGKQKQGNRHNNIQTQTHNKHKDTNNVVVCISTCVYICL